ncbi:restriction endonuclease [Shimia sp. R9_3]|uniref:restriction endonuclease n=1 Tax=Shimia sp. R9_3 TaxID=2821113 RepID=UPI001ADB15AE|nr:restriction endonuclease [Shimia sp. R9_3]
MSGPVAAAKAITSYIQLEAPPRSLNDVLRQIIEVENSVDALEAADIAQRWLARFESRVRHELNEAEQDGVALCYGFNSANPDYVQGACFVEGGDTEAVRAEKAARAKQERYLEFYEQLNPVRFERLCGKVLGLLAVEEPHVTRASADQGVDFFGRLPFGTLLTPRHIPAGAEKQLSAWLVGQAKHYVRTSVSTKDIRELVGSVLLARSKTYAGHADPLAELDIRVCDPVVYFFVTTGRFTRDSRDLLRKSGVVAMDGLQLSVFLADNLAAQGGGELTVEAIADWLDK